MPSKRTPKPDAQHCHELFQALHDEVVRLQAYGISRPLARLAEENPELWQGVKDALSTVFASPRKGNLSPAEMRRRLDTLTIFLHEWKHPDNTNPVLLVLCGHIAPEDAFLSPETGDECEQARREAEVWAEWQACLGEHDPLERARVVASYHLSVWQARWYLPGVADVASVVKASNPVLARAYAEWLHDVDPHAPPPDEPFLGEPFLHQREDAEAVQQVRDERAILADIEGMIARDDIEGVFAKYLPEQADQCHVLRELQAKTAAKPTLSEPAARVHKFAVAYKAENGTLPVYDDMVAGLQMGRSTISKAIKELRQAGLWQDRPAVGGKVRKRRKPREQNRGPKQD